VREVARLHEVGQVYADEAADFGTHQEETYRLSRGAAIGEKPASWLLHARESFDGSGPEGLAGDAIPIESRVIRASCAFHGATAEPADGSDVPALTRGVQRIRSQAGAELDPEVVAALVTVVERAV
jgi:HD-GYP domain-containing protein (c-di-GMP phosphodiesterase class II)